MFVEAEPIRRRFGPVLHPLLTFFFFIWFPFFSSLTPSNDMLRSINSSLDLRDDHLRHLLDQRTTRADMPGRFSALSQFPDTPSVYSRAFFSPRPQDQEFASPTTTGRSPHKSPATSSHDDHLHDPDSVLDLGDDSRVSNASTNFYEDDQRSVDNNDDDDDDEPMPRMSVLGPKMRFHSRAPWELDGDQLLEEEPELNPLTSSSKKGFVFPGQRSTSASRPSGDTVYSQDKPKKSFDTVSSRMSYPRGAL